MFLIGRHSLLGKFAVSRLLLRLEFLLHFPQKLHPFSQTRAGPRKGRWGHSNNGGSPTSAKVRLKIFMIIKIEQYSDKILIFFPKLTELKVDSSAIEF